jgi:hypothetical protein
MLFEMGDMLLDMLKANQALASAASSMMDAAHNLIDVHTDNGAVRLLCLVHAATC